MNRAPLTLLIAVFISSTSASAKEVPANYRDAHINYVTAKGGQGNIEKLLFEANFEQPYLYEISDYFAVSLSMKTVLRMLQARSAPIRTPSLMPGVAVYVGTPLLSGMVELRHHSNGQDAGFYLVTRDEPVLNSNGQPVIIDGRPETRTNRTPWDGKRALRRPANEAEEVSVNVINGSFSTNYFRFALLSTHLAPEARIPSSIGLEWHPGFNQNSEIRDGYSNFRAYLHLDWVKALPKDGYLRASGRVELYLDGREAPRFVDNVDEPSPYGIDAKLLVSCRHTVFGVFVNFYHGQDYYNIWYNRDLSVLRLGISLTNEFLDGKQKI